MYIIYPYIIPGRSVYWEKLGHGTGIKDRGHSFFQYGHSSAGKEHFHFFLKLNEILPKRARMIKGCNYGKILHELKNFSSSRW